MTALLVDASGYINRAYFALPALTNSAGNPTHAVHGYTEMIWQLRRRTEQASHIVVCFDKGRSARRAELFPAYKANRPAKPDEFIAQLNWIRDATRALGCAVVEMQGVEADDLLASYATAFAAQGVPVTIVTSDKDLMQIMSPAIQLWCPLKKQQLTVADCLEKFGVPPSRVIDAQAMIGDSVDNIPGVPRIGRKTAGELLAQFGSLDNLLANIDDIPQKSARMAVATHVKQALLSRELARLDRNVPLPLPIDELCTKPIDPKSLLTFTSGMEFASLSADISTYYGVAA